MVNFVLATFVLVFVQYKFNFNYNQCKTHPPHLTPPGQKHCKPEINHVQLVTRRFVDCTSFKQKNLIYVSIAMAIDS